MSTLSCSIPPAVGLFYPELGYLPYCAVHSCRNTIELIGAFCICTRTDLYLCTLPIHVLVSKQQQNNPDRRKTSTLLHPHPSTLHLRNATGDRPLLSHTAQRSLHDPVHDQFTMHSKSVQEVLLPSPHATQQRV